MTPDEKGSAKRCAIDMEANMAVTIGKQEKKVVKLTMAFPTNEVFVALN